MIKTYLKTLLRMFKKHITRLLSLISIVLLSIGFVSGLGSATDKMRLSLTSYYQQQNVSDFIIKASAEKMRTGGFVQEDIDAVKNIFDGAEINTGMSIDVQTDKEQKLSVRYYFIDFDNWTVNVPDIVEGDKIESVNYYECYAESADHVIEGYGVGEKIEIDLSAVLGMPQLSAVLKPIEVTVRGTVQSPLTFANDGEMSYNNPEDVKIDNYTTSGAKDYDCLENIIYLSKDLIPQGLMPIGDIYVSIKDRTLFNAFSKKYESYVKQSVEKINSLFGAYDEVDENGNTVEKNAVTVLTLNENISFQSLKFYYEKLEMIGYILMVAFLFVTALVVLSTMTRMLEEERSQIACLKTLGYSSFQIISKYLLFALIATGIGGASAYGVGIGISYLLYHVFNYSFVMPPMSSNVAIVFYIIVLTIIVLATLAATVIAGIKMTNENPANLLRPKPPKAGKKVILEKIPFIWNRLSFKYKSTMRNVLRYKSRFFMTVIAVAVSTALVLAGLALLDLCLFHDFGSVAIMCVAIVIIAFAGLLTAAVIYTLTNINISERNREIATLMVLGYHDKEVAGYIYREVYINTIIGSLFGYPVAALLIWFVFSIMATGTLAGVSWFMWLIAPFIVLLFTMLVTLILRRKIVKINMNESLKAIE